MKIELVLSTLLFSCVTVAQDRCTPQVEAYLQGLDVGASLAAITEEQRNKAVKQMEYIQSIRKSLNDCQVADHIPALAVRKKALAIANKALE
jgi:hypothetical protein